MKIHIDLPWGGVLHIEKEKGDSEFSFLSILIVSIAVVIVNLFG